MLGSMSPSTLAGDPPCPPAVGDESSPAASPRSCGRSGVRSTRSIATTWDTLLAANPWATPFSRWAFHRAWWDAYGANAHEETLVVVPADAPGRRHAGRDRPAHAPPRGGARTTSSTRRRSASADGPPLTPVPPDAKARVLRRLVPRRLRDAPVRARRPAAAAAAALADYCASDGDPGHPAPWDAVDLRRLRCGDPAADALERRLRAARDGATGWTVASSARTSARSRRSPTDARHRRVPRHARQEGAPRDPAQGPARGGRRARSRSIDCADPLADLDAFIDLHQKRWGDRRPVPRHARRRAEPRVHPAAVRAVRRRRTRCGSRS